MLGKPAVLRPMLAAISLLSNVLFFLVFRMKRANSLNVLNVGGREKQDSVQVRRQAVQQLLALKWWHQHKGLMKKSQSAVCLSLVAQPSRLTDVRGLSSSTQNLTRRGSLGGSS